MYGFKPDDERLVKNVRHSMQFYDRVITVTFASGAVLRLSRELATAMYLDGKVVGKDGQEYPAL